MKAGSQAGRERLISILSPLTILLVWQILASLGLTDERFIPSPLSILRSAVDLTRSGELSSDIGASLFRLAVGFVIGTIPGVFVGLVMGVNRPIRAALDPLVSAIYPIPKIAIFPLLMIVFGIGDGSKIAAVAISVFFLMIINTMAGVLTIDPIYFDVAANLNAPWRKRFLRVVLPAALPSVFAGLRVGIGVSLIVLVGAEFVASDVGIGYLIWSSWQTLIIEKMFVGIIAITILGLIFAFILKEAERWLMPWRSRSS